MPEVFAPEATPSVVALFDPTASPPVVPTPNDLAFRGGDGKHLMIGDQPGDSPAQRDFNAYLRTLDGFPSSSTASAAFSAPLDPGSLAQAVSVIDAQTGARVDAVQVQLSPDGTRIIVTPTAHWLPAHRYAVLVFGGRDPAGVRGAAGQVVVAAPAFFLIRSPNPLLARCLDPGHPECVCPAVTDPSCHSVARGVDDATARAAEAERQTVDPAISALLGILGRARTDLVQLWSFTITSRPTAVLDPARSQVPFPNDLLINQATGLVNLPIAPGDPQAALKMQLNTLDGFSVSAPITASVELPPGDAIDAASLMPGVSTVLASLGPRMGPLLPSFAAVAPAADIIALQPLEALLSDQNRYGVVLTRAIHDTAGNALEPPPVMVLLRTPNPLFDGTHATVNVLTDQQAALLEPLRAAFQPLFEQLAAAGIARDQIALAWTFSTESITRPLQALDAFPAQRNLSTDLAITTVVADADLVTRAPSLPFASANLRAVVLGTFASEDVIDRTQGQIMFDRMGDQFTVRLPPGDPPTSIKFWLSLPRTPASAAGAPVVILQHGFTSWRGDMLALADDFGRAGWAAIAFDINFHGARTVCTADAQCAAGPCTNGVCAGGLRPQPASENPLACALQPLSGDPLDCNPAASGAAFIDPGDLFMTRANGQSYVIDAAQLVRVLRASSLSADIDSDQIAFLGHSLGAIGGTLFVSVDAAPRTVVLNVGAAHDFDALAAGRFAPLVDRYLESIGVQRGTPAYAQVAATARWVLDAVDPWSVARYVTKPAIVQEAGMDTTIPPPFQEELALALFGPMGLDAMHHALGRQTDGTAVSTFFPTAVHGTLSSGIPAGESARMRTQAQTFITSGGAVLP